MRNILDMDTVQIEVCDDCCNLCSNCTRFVGHKKPFFMSFEIFKSAIDSLINYPKMIGFQGGEPLLHPYFEDFCNYASSKIPKERLGLWTTLPKGYEYYREIIVNTFGHIFINDHTRDDIYHHPPLVSIEEVVKDKDEMWYYIDHCWAQESWSASINPKGAYFCERAAAFAMLYDGPNGWPIIDGWWKKTRKDYTEQIEYFCPKCGMACPLHRRASTQKIDDISPYHYEKLKNVSRKIENGLYKINDCEPVFDKLEELAAYKDFNYRNNIAKRYGMFLIINEFGFWTPYLYEDKEKKFKKVNIHTYKETEIEGWFLIEELQWLYDVSSKMESVVEIGCWKGRSTHAILSGCKGKVYIIDNFLGNKDQIGDIDNPGPHYEASVRDISIDFLKNCGHFKNLNLMKMDSAEAVKYFKPKSIDMVFIDGDHSREAIKQDIDMWTPIAKKIICGHDYGSNYNEGDVKEIVDEIFKDKVILRKDITIWSVDL
jgi:hypothetical protein